MELIITLFFTALSLVPSFGSQGIQQLQHWRANAGYVQLASTTADLRVPSLANLDCIGTDGDGDFGEGTCTGGSGSGIEAYDAWLHPSAGSSATTSLLHLTAGASTTRFSALQAWFGATASSSFDTLGMLDIQGWRVSTTTTVCAVGCEFTDIQSAENAGWRDIKVKAGTYTLTAPVTLSEDGTRICGEGDATIVRYDGAAMGAAFQSDGVILNGITICDLQILSTTVGSGVGVDIGKMKHATLENLFIKDVNIGVQGTTTSTFYNNLNNLRIEPKGGGASPGNFCFLFSSFANKNEIHDGRCFHTTTASTTGVVADAGGLKIQGIDISGVALAIDVQDEGANISIEDVWLESNWIAIKIAYGVETVHIDGATHITSCLTVCIQDLGGEGVYNFSAIEHEPHHSYSGEGVKFGIGTTTPQERLDLYATTSKSLLYVRGGGADFIQSGIRLDSTASLRGAGVYTYDEAGDVEWYFGDRYNGDAFVVNRRPSATAFTTDAANPDDADVTNLLSVTTSGASTTGLVVSGLNAANCDVKASTSGVFSCGTDATGGGGSFPFPTDTNFNQVVYSTTTPTLWFKGGLFASSTSHFDNSTTSLATITTAWLTNLFIGADTIAEYIADTAGAFFTGNTETGITATYQDADNTVDLVCDTASASVFGCLSTTDWSTFNGKLSAYDAWAHPQAGVSATSSGLIISASTSIPFLDSINATSTFATSSILAISTVLTPDAADGAALGSLGLPFSDLFLASGGVINWNNDVTLTHASNDISVAGGRFNLAASDGFRLPVGTGPTVDASAEMAFDTSQNELIIATTTDSSSPAVIKPWDTIRFSYAASSTPGVGTSTRSLAVAPAPGYIDQIVCNSNSFFRVVIYDASGNRTNDLIASSTQGVVKLTANNAFTENEPILVDIGTTTSPAAHSYLGCTAKYYYTRN